MAPCSTQPSRDQMAQELQGRRPTAVLVDAVPGEGWSDTVYMNLRFRHEGRTTEEVWLYVKEEGEWRLEDVFSKEAGERAQ
ncbi:MAG: hypothetical protein AAGA56_01015 [Myxococcota bacterium]